ncbi:MAG: 4-hydroxy-tetrahydrodipicolinate reductase [Cyclobacteriaceae bacterium]|nr:4-hydroxy-tetrahydrodipicolinate reductase [Cyclobacteriaceae bacterium]
MKIALVGYGKMGIAIEELATKAGHRISHKIDKDNHQELTELTPANTDIIIEFSNPDIAVGNILFCLKQHIPVVCGTTGWLHNWDKVKEACNATNGTFFYASNYSIGVNLFFKINEYAAKLMAKQAYNVEIEEIHHTEKKDSPSGTAITIAEPIMQARGIASWVNKKSENGNNLGIISKREASVPGTHTVAYTSKIDKISMTHIAHSRKGFAKGALAVAEWIVKTKARGMLNMNNFLTI